MPEFQYTARDTTGNKITGTIAAAGRREAAANLVAKALFPVDVQEAGNVVETKSIRRVPAQLLAVTYSQLADLLRSGVPLLRALEVIRKQTSHNAMNQVLSEVCHQVEEGSTLADAFNRFPRVFGEMAVNMIRAGGEGGFLEEALIRVAEFTEATEDLKKRTLGAVAYPAILAIFGVTLVIVLIVFFVPQFENLFSQLRQRNELPALTETLLWLSETLRGRYGLALLAAAIAGVGFARYSLNTEKGRLWSDRAKMKLPIVGPIFQSLAVARFCRVLGTLLKNGVPILRSMDISRNATGNRVLAIAIGNATENISAGQSLAEPLAASGQFPPSVVEMIAVAEQANNLEAVLLDTADTLEKRTWRKLDLAVRLIEPLMLLLIAGLVLLMAIALLQPMFNMSRTI
ncbi:MAG: type II secretion system F family protein [Pirellulales bacterium]|nr:type II secretion system F family protein [Pirellulales bacterium]